MKKLIKISIILLFITSCQSAKDAFTLKKTNSTDEFLVEKKNPLVMPPDFDKLPLPKNVQNNENLSNEESIEDLISSDKKVLKKKGKDSQSSSIEKLILDEIN